MSACANEGWSRDNESIVAYFTERAERYGHSTQAADWGSTEAQQLRFNVLLDVGVRSGDSLIDVGCGTGSLLDWLKRRDLAIDYRGIDLTPAMVEIAKSNHPSANFAVCDVLRAKDIPSADFVVGSGLFYLRKERPLEFVEAMLVRLWVLARRGIAVNCLSAWANRKDPGEFYACPREVLGIAGRITRSVVLRHDYHPGDFTVYLYK